MDREQIEQLWSDKGNWTWGVIYHCREDPRVIVPRLWRWGGWTLNFSHPKAGLAGLVAMGLAVGPVLLALYWFNDWRAIGMAMMLSLVALIAWASFESARTG